MSFSFLGTMLSLNYFFVFCCLWGVKWGLTLLLNRGKPGSCGSRTPSDPIRWPIIPWPEHQVQERLLVWILALTSLSFVLLNPFPHLYNYLFIGPFFVLLVTPCVTVVLESFCAAPRRPALILLCAGFFLADVTLPFHVSRHSLDGLLQHDAIVRAHSRIPPTETVLDSSCRFFRPAPTKNVPRIPFTGALSELGLLAPVAPDLVRARCRFVYWDALMEEFLLSTDRDFIKRNYLPLEGDLWVLGRRISPDPPDSRLVKVDIEVPGTYTVQLEPRTSNDGPKEVEVDGRSVQTEMPVSLEVGRRSFSLPRAVQALTVRALTP